MENQIDIVDEIKKLVPVLGKENASRVERAYLLGEEETKNRLTMPFGASYMRRRFGTRGKVRIRQPAPRG